MAKNLFVGNLAFSVTDDELRSIFEKAGQVVSAKVIMDRETGRSRGFGFVEMTDDNGAREAISKLNNTMAAGRQITVGEEMAKGFCRRRQVQIASMRFHGLWDHARQRAHKATPNSDPFGRPAMQFWGWLDRWDAARACRLAIEREWEGHRAFFLNASDTTLTIPTEEAIRRVFPGVPMRRPLPGFAAAIDTGHAERVLGWRPERTWRDA